MLHSAKGRATILQYIAFGQNSECLCDDSAYAHIMRVPELAYCDFVERLPINILFLHSWQRLNSSSVGIVFSGVSHGMRY